MKVLICCHSASFILLLSTSPLQPAMCMFCARLMSQTSALIAMYNRCAGQVALMGQAEAFRAAGEAPGVEGLDKLYPGLHSE